MALRYPMLYSDRFLLDIMDIIDGAPDANRQLAVMFLSGEA
jgi:hypothetical protein